MARIGENGGDSEAWTYRGPKRIQGTPDALATSVQHIGIDHHRLHVLVAQQLLNCTDIAAILRAMVRSGRDHLKGRVEVDESYWGGEETGAIGRRTQAKAPIVVAAECDGTGLGRVRLRRVPDLTKAGLHGFVAEAVEPGSTVCTDGLTAYLGLKGYLH